MGCSAQLTFLTSPRLFGNTYHARWSHRPHERVLLLQSFRWRVMTDDFSPEIYWTATRKDRVAICRKMAAEAERLASEGRNKRAEY